MCASVLLPAIKLDKQSFFWKIVAGELYQGDELIASATATAIVRTMPK